MSHKDKSALITGGTGGLGKAIAEAFLNAGANVVVCDINKERIAEFKDKVASAHADRTLVLECDITDDSALDELFKLAEGKFGALDFVVNCAAIIDHFEPMGEMPRSRWDRVIALNLTAPAMIIQRAVNMMIKADVKGSIVNIASIAGTRGYTCGAAYTSSKHGLLGLTKNTAAFYGPNHGIRCNAVMPGAMETNIADNLRDGFSMEGMGTMRKYYPDGTMPLVPIAKVAQLVLYICSDAAEVINGACVTADGGCTAA